MANIDLSWMGYAALLVLLATAVAARLDHIRLGIALAALLAIPVAVFGRLGMGYTLLLLAIFALHIGLVARVWLRDSHVRFSAEEQQLRDRHFERLTQAATRALIDQGYWISARRGDVLIRESAAAPCLFYLAEGAAAIRRDGKDIGAVSDGALIGEATVLDGTHATGTVILTSNARLWFIPAAGLRAYLAANPDVASALHEGFARALRGKLASANARIADRGSLS